MYFDSLGAALQMNGHGGYVWAAYGITLVVLVALLAVPLRRQNRFLKQLAGELKRQPPTGGLTEGN